MAATELDILLHRARRLARTGRAHLAYELYRQALLQLADADPGDYRLVLHETLDVCEDYFDIKDSARLETARELLEASDHKDARAHVLLGTALSVAARDLRRDGRADDAEATAREAEEHLERATTLADFDSDAWGALGGVRKRLADWAYKDGRADDAATHERGMLQAYLAGALSVPDAYPILNYIEQRAAIQSTPLLSDDDEALRAQLARALHIRRRQFARGEDRPWAAFDLARGQHYLAPNVPRFLHDLEVAVDDARAVARTADDRWMVQTAVESLRNLTHGALGVDGMREGIALLERAVMDDRWVAGSWGPLGRPPEFLASELQNARSGLRTILEQLESSGAQQAELKERMERFVSEGERRWSEADEAAFNEMVPKIARSFEPGYRKALRVVWKVFGRGAVSHAVALTPIPEVAEGLSMVAAYVTSRIDERV